MRLLLDLGVRTFIFKRDWERELGQSYIDDEVWFECEPKNFYLKPQYVNKTSRDLQVW